MEWIDKFVRFDLYCDKCEHYDKEDHEDPCHDCLQEPVNEYSSKPVYYKPKEEFKNWVAPQAGGDNGAGSGSGSL